MVEEDLDQWPLSRLLIMAGRLVENDIAEQLRFLHLTHASHALLALVAEDSKSQSQLARATHVEQQTISRLVDRLEDAGLVTRAPDPSDRRRHLVTATAAGRAAIQEAVTHDHVEGILADLPDPEQLRGTLTTLIKRLRSA